MNFGTNVTHLEDPGMIFIYIYPYYSILLQEGNHRGLETIGRSYRLSFPWNFQVQLTLMGHIMAAIWVNIVFKNMSLNKLNI